MNLITENVTLCPNANIHKTKQINLLQSCVSLNNDEPNLPCLRYEGENNVTPTTFLKLAQSGRTCSEITNYGSDSLLTKLFT